MADNWSAADSNAAYDAVSPVSGEPEYNPYGYDYYDYSADPPTDEAQTVDDHAAYDENAYEYGSYDPNTTEYGDPAQWTYGDGYAAESTEGFTFDENASYFGFDDAQDANAAPPSPFNDEAYWQQYGQSDYPVEGELEGDHSDPGGGEQTLQLESTSTGATLADVADIGLTPAPLEVDSPPTNQGGSELNSTPSTTQQSVSSKKSKKVKTKQERIQRRQELLEKEEAEKQASPPDNNSASTTGSPGVNAAIEKAKSTRNVAARPMTFLERERARVRLQIRKARAIGRKRMPLQVRILTQPRTRASPMEIYFGSCVESVMSDIFWAAMKGDLRRVRFLVEIEKISVTDSQFDPWHMEQTPLHWAAKGGHSAVLEYLLQAGANPRSLDETGSLPLHLACWAGHVEATIMLLRATDTKDLYVQDYDAGLAPLDWVHLRAHTHLLKAIAKYEDMMWLPKFVDDLIRGIIRYKIKLFKEPPKSPKSPSRALNFRRTPATPTNATPGADAATPDMSSAPVGKESKETPQQVTEPIPAMSL